MPPNSPTAPTTRRDSGLRLLGRSLLLAVATVGLLTSACSPPTTVSTTPAQPAPTEVAVGPVRTGPLQRAVRVTGTLFADEEMTLSAKVPGRVMAVLHDVGDVVGPGKILARVDPTDYELQISRKSLALRETLAKLGVAEIPSMDKTLDDLPSVRRAQMQAANAEARFQRGKQLHEQTPPLMSDQDYADLQTTVDVAKSTLDVERLNVKALIAEAYSKQADLRTSQQQLADTTAAVPAENVPARDMPAADGRDEGGTRSYAIAARMVSVGDYVREGSPMFKLLDEDPIKLRTPVPERHLARIKLGQRVRVEVEAWRDPFIGVVTRINPQTDVRTRSFTVEISIQNSERRLKVGAFAKAAIETESSANVIFVPASSIASFAGVQKVYTVVDGKAVEKPVVLGERDGDWVEARSGVGATDVVVTDGAQSLAHGTPVRVRGSASLPASRPGDPPR